MAAAPTRPTGSTGDLRFPAQALRRRAIYRRHTRHFAGWRLRLPAYGVYRRSSLPSPASARAGQSIGAVPAISPGGGCALPGLGVRAACHSFTHLRD
ncbi:hypothetical protein IUJ34_01010 [Klebsiella pneumoniae subsp. pneumoniae]|uniref:Uncharacterized protein n=1 Tax=Klebsiella pneumoniae subsp. pneumoniae TaxID=72407 RepID=A0A7S9E0Z8_KLEPN|nr:hypothetical protein IUJ34_01010 [Klebsiella pneumoniae subsp. pneumoniae]